MAKLQWVTKDLAMKVNQILCNIYGFKSVVRSGNALEEVINEARTVYTREHGDPSMVLSCLTIGFIEKQPFENCNKRTALVLFNYYLEKECGFTLTDDDKYKYASNFKYLDEKGNYFEEFKLWVERYINLRITAKVNNADYAFG